MNIGLVRRGYSDTGGAESYLKRFAGALASEGHTSLLFTSRHWKGEWPFGEVCVVPGDSPRAFADAFATLDPSTRCDRVFSLERVWKCDCYRAGDGVHRAWLERRSYFEPAWKARFRNLQPKHRALLEMETKLFKGRGASLVIANSQMVKDEIARYFGYAASDIHVIYNGVSGVSPTPPLPNPKERLGLAEDTFVVLFAGSGWERKGLRFAIKAINACVSSPLLLVAGKGNPKGCPASDRVKFLGPVRNMPEIFAAADLFLLPTIYDPFSNACLEALAAGLPVITSAANGFAEIIESGVEGEVLPDPSDIVALARAIDAWSDPRRRRAIRPSLAKIAAGLTIDANVRATLNLLRKPPANGREL